MRAAITTFLLFFLLPSPAAGQDFAPILTIPPGDDHIVPIKKGEPAPFAGQLFDPMTALRWGNWLEQYRIRLKLDVDLQKKLDSAEIRSLTVQLEAERKKYLDVTSEYRARVVELEKKLEKPIPWYKTSEFGFSMGVVTSLIVVVGAAVLVSSL